MAHLIDFSTGLPAIAFTGETPWHGLGEKINPDAPLEEWLRCARLEWTVEQSPVEWAVGDTMMQAPNRHVLYRSDTKHLLNVVSDKYNVVQPAEILEFYRDLVEGSMFTMETAGALKDGGKVWALAKAARPIRVRGNDIVNPYLLLATSTDGTLSTTGKFTSVRVVCNNTLTLAYGGSRDGEVRVPHHSVFDAKKMKEQLGVIEAVSEEFEAKANKLAGLKLKKDDAIRFFVDLFCEDDETEVDLAKPTQTKVGQLFYLYRNSPGHDLPSADGTAWGAVNAVTRFVDYATQSKSQDNRLNSAWFGVGNKLKSRALDAALKLAA